MLSCLRVSRVEVLRFDLLLLYAPYSIYTVLVLSNAFSIFSYTIIVYNALECFILLFYKSASVVYVPFERWLLSHIFYSFSLPQCLCNFSIIFLYTFSVLCPCPLLKKGHCHRLIDKNDIHLVWWYSVAIVRLRHILHLWKVSTCQRVLISTYFISLVLIRKKVTFQSVLP